MKSLRSFSFTVRQVVCLCIVFLFAPGLAMAQSSTITTKTDSRLAGTATPTAGETIRFVDVSIRDSVSLEFWNGSQFQSGFIRTPAVVTGNNWSYAIAPRLPQGVYFVSVRTVDSGGNAQSPLTAESIVLDSGNPSSTITAASANTIRGDASDNPGGAGVARVEIALRDADNRFWNGTAFAPGYRRVLTTLTANGTWTYDISPALTREGRYFVSSIAFDLAGNVQQRPYGSTSFVVAPPADTVRPTSTIASATDAAISGAARDNNGIDRVELAIRSGNQYWNGSSFQNGYIRVDATVTGNGGSVDWDYTVNPALPAGSYNVAVVAFDTARNAQQPFTAMAFNVEAPEPLRVMALGDSITQGSYQGTGSNTSVFSYRRRFTELMDATTCNYEMVGSQRDTRSVSSFQSPHEGYSGHRVDHFITGLSANPGIDTTLAEFNPDVVLLHLGSNDMFRGHTVTSTVIELITVIDRIVAANPDTLILVANVIPWYGTSPFNPDIQADTAALGTQVNQMIRNFSSRNIRLANVRNGFFPFMMQQEDLIHPNSLGDAHIANAFFDALSAAPFNCGNL